jgi:WD40 repeat protein
VSLSPDDKTLYAIDTTAGEIYDLDVATGKQEHEYPLPPGSALGYTFNSDVLAAISADGTVSEVSLATGKVYAQVKNPGSAAVATVRPDRDGRYVLFSDTNGAAYLVDAQSKQAIGTFRYPYLGASTVYPQVSLDGSTVYVPGGTTAPAQLWNTVTKGYTTPADSLWPTPDNGLTFATDSKFVLTSPTTVSETVDVWDIATRAHVITVTVPGGANEVLESIGPGASELLSTSGYDINKGTFAKLNIWAVPG